LVHELAQQACVALLFANEELGDARQELLAVSGREAVRRAQEPGAVGLLTELEGGDGAGDEPALLRAQSAARAAGRTARLLSVVFEVIQPYPQIREHWSSPPAKPGGESRRRSCGHRGGIVANSGRGTGSVPEGQEA